jgi:hypothetical protein
MANNQPPYHLKLVKEGRIDEPPRTVWTRIRHFGAYVAVAMVIAMILMAGIHSH